MKSNKIARFIWCLLLAAMFCIYPQFAVAQMTVIGEEVVFERAAPFIGDILYLTLHFTVQGLGAAIPIAFSAVESGRSPDPNIPTLASHRYDIRPGPHSVRILSYRIPRPAPSEICFNVYAHFSGTGLRNALIVQNACWGTAPRRGTGQRIELKPDLSVNIGSLSFDRPRDVLPRAETLYPLTVSFTIKNTGTSPTQRTGRCCAVSIFLPSADGSWVAGWNPMRPARELVCELIPGGGAQSFTQTFNVPSGTRKIKFEADPVNLLHEYNEDNNSAERDIGLPRLRMTPFRPNIPR